MKRINFLKFYNRGIGAVVAVSLLMIVSVVAAVGFQNWFASYQSDLQNQVNDFRSDSISLEYLDGNVLYVKNSAPNNFIFNEIKIEDKSCGVNGSILANSMNKIALNGCTVGMTIGPKKVVLVSDNSILEKTLMFRSTYSGNYSFSFQSGTGCGAGYTRLYGLEYLSNSHAELANSTQYTYSACLSYNGINLGTTCTGNYTRMIYLDDVSNAHAYTDNSSTYEDTFYEVCLNVDVGSIVSEVSDTDPADGSFCVGSMDGIDNQTGVHMGDCNAYSTKIWVRINP